MINREPRLLTLEAFARERGLLTTADVQAHIHAGLRSMPTTKTYARWNATELKRLQDARDETERLYRAAIASGEVRGMTAMERLEANANGHPDHESTHAARRILAKKRAIATQHPTPGAPPRTP